MSRALIQREQADVIRRTQRRIAQLRATENSKHNDDDPDPVIIHSHCGLNTLCFCVWLAIMNLLFLQWLYYDVRKST